MSEDCDHNTNRFFTTAVESPDTAVGTAVGVSIAVLVISIIIIAFIIVITLAVKLHTRPKCPGET